MGGLEGDIRHFAGCVSPANENKTQPKVMSLLAKMVSCTEVFKSSLLIDHLSHLVMTCANSLDQNQDRQTQIR